MISSDQEHVKHGTCVWKQRRVYTGFVENFIDPMAYEVIAYLGHMPINYKLTFHGIGYVKGMLPLEYVLLFILLSSLSLAVNVPPYGSCGWWPPQVPRFVGCSWCEW